VRWIVRYKHAKAQVDTQRTGHAVRRSRCARHAREARDAQVMRAGPTPRLVGVPEPLTRVTAGRSHTRSRRKRAYTSPLRRRQVGGGPTLERAKSTHYRHAYQHVKRPEITRNPAPTSQTTVPESGAGGGWNVGPEPESTDIRCSKTWRSTANIDSSDLRSQCGGLSDLHCVPTA